MGPKMRMAISTQVNTDYWVADLLPDGTYDVYTIATSIGDPPIYTKTLPEGWQSIQLQWARNTDYFGVFRAMTGNMEFAADCRAILNHLFALYGQEADAKLHIYRRIDSADVDPSLIWTYEEIYNCYLDFTQYNDDLQTLKCSIATLDGGIYQYLKAYGDTELNIPLWYKTTDDEWVTDGVFFKPQGIYLNWSQTWTSAASPTNPLVMGISVNDQRYLPAMNPLSTIPYIGNEIMGNNLPTKTQSSRGVFADTDYNNYTTDNGIMMKFGATTSVYFQATAEVTCTQIIYGNPSTGETTTIQLCIQQIDTTNTPVGAAFVLADYVISNDPGFATDTELVITNPVFNIYTVPVPILENNIYIVTEIITKSASGYDLITKPEYTNFKVKVYADATTALRYPESPCLGFDLRTFWGKIVERLSSTEVDPNGFQIVSPSNTFSGYAATLISDVPVADCISGNLLWTSGNALRVINGVPYITTSLNRFFKDMFGLLGACLKIVPDDNSILALAPISEAFDNTTEILNLGTNVAKLQVAPLLDYLGTSLKTGYSTKWQDFNQYIGNQVSFYGVDAFNFGQEYKMPLKKKKGVIDWQVEVIAEPFKIESERSSQQQNESSSPSSSNSNYIMEMDDTLTEGTFYTPAGDPYTTFYRTPLQFPTSQNTDPLTAPYVRGLSFGGNTYNLTISPRKNLQRLGGLLHSILDSATDYVSFMKQYWQMQNGNSNIELGGIETNLYGDLYTEVADIDPATLPDKIFRPILFRFECSGPINMLNIVNANPYGYISFMWNNKQYKGFIWEVAQNIAENQVTTFTLLATPDFEF